MSLTPDQEAAKLGELSKLVNGKKLGQVFDALEPRAKKLAKQPSSVSFSVLFGSLFGAIGLTVGVYVGTVWVVPWYLIILLTSFLITSGLALGNIVSMGRNGLRLERKGRAIAGFLEQITPYLSQTKQTDVMKDITRQLGEAVQDEIDRELKIKPKQLPPAETENENPKKEKPRAPSRPFRGDSAWYRKASKTGTPKSVKRPKLSKDDESTNKIDNDSIDQL